MSVFLKVKVLLFYSEGRLIIMCTTELCFIKKNITEIDWQNFIEKISTYNGIFKSWKITITFDYNKVNYFINTLCSLPASINEIDFLMLKKTDTIENPKAHVIKPLFLNIGCNAIDIKNHFDFKVDEKILFIEIKLKKLGDNKIINRITVYTLKNGRITKYFLLLGIPSYVLKINFESNFDLCYKTAPKYLDMSKNLYLLNSNVINSILSVDAFPYIQGDFYLSQRDIDFGKHSLVLGSSGCGKSKFLSLLIKNIYTSVEFKDRYKVVVIDPHAALEDDIGGLGEVIDFTSMENSIDLFSNDNDETIISVELLLDIFKSLIPNSYNSKLERVLRHSLYLLLSKNVFDFKNLRNLLLDVDFRHALIKTGEDSLPKSIVEFFLAEFNEIKTRSYTEAISPIIAFIDEMEMIPVFNEEKCNISLRSVINNNFLTCFSLDRTKLGDKVTKTLSGLIMQQMMTLVQAHSFDRHIIFIIDEVAVVENPILARFLSEARKYNLSLILSGQYFEGIEEYLRKAIFANVINYYIFRVSKSDAEILVNDIDIKIPLDNSKEQKVKLLTDLQNRECVVRISSREKLLSAIKCKTLNYESVPRKKKSSGIAKNDNEEKKEEKAFKVFDINSNVDLKSILMLNSTSRKVLKDE